jgi:hypothetical protein
MICEQDLNILIRTCRPYLNRNQLYVFLVNLCNQLSEDTCVAVLPAGTQPEDFIEDGFLGTVPAGCEELIVVYDDGTKIWHTHVENIEWCNVLQLPAPQIAFKVNADADQTINTGAPITGIFDLINTEFDFGNQVDLVNNVVAFPIHYDGFWKLGANITLSSSVGETLTITIRSTSGSPTPLKIYVQEDILVFADIDNSFSLTNIVLIEEDQELEVAITGNTGTITVNTHSGTTHNTFWGHKLRGNFSGL